MSAVLPVASLEAVSADLYAHCEQAARYSQTIQRCGHGLIVMMSASEYVRLAALDHISIASADMSDADAEDMRNAGLSSGSFALNKLLSDRAI